MVQFSTLLLWSCFGLLLQLAPCAEGRWPSQKKAESALLASDSPTATPQPTSPAFTKLASIATGFNGSSSTLSSGSIALTVGTMFYFGTQYAEYGAGTLFAMNISSMSQAFSVEFPNGIGQLIASKDGYVAVASAPNSPNSNPNSSYIQGYNPTGHLIYNISVQSEVSTFLNLHQRLLGHTFFYSKQVSIYLPNKQYAIDIRTGEPLSPQPWWLPDADFGGQHTSYQKDEDHILLTFWNPQAFPPVDHWSLLNWRTNTTILTVQAPASYVGSDARYFYCFNSTTNNSGTFPTTNLDLLFYSRNTTTPELVQNITFPDFRLLKGATPALSADGSEVTVMARSDGLFVASVTTGKVVRTVNLGFPRLPVIVEPNRVAVWGDGENFEQPYALYSYPGAHLLGKVDRSQGIPKWPEHGFLQFSQLGNASLVLGSCLPGTYCGTQEIRSIYTGRSIFQFSNTLKAPSAFGVLSSLSVFVLSSKASEVEVYKF